MSEKYLLTRPHRDRDGAFLYWTFASDAGGLITWVERHTHAIQLPLPQIQRLAKRFIGGELQVISVEQLEDSGKEKKG